MKHKPINKSKKNINKPRYISGYESEYEPEYEPIYTIIEPTNLERQILNFAGLRSRLSRYDLQECNQFKCMSRTPTFVWLNYDEYLMHHLKRKYYRTRIYLQNSLTNIDSIDDKDKLHLDMETYQQSNWNNPDIHDTHLKSSDRDWFFPDDFTNSNITNPETNPGKNQSEMIPDIINQNRVILTAVAKLLSETVELYDNVKNGFNVFGVDLMITSDSRGNAKVVLLECNSEGTYKTKESGTHKKLENILFTWIDKVILAPLFNKDKKSIKTDGKTDKITISDGKYKYHSYKLFSKIIQNNLK